MAKNRVFPDGRYIKVAIASMSSGDPAVFGQIPGVCTENTDGDGNVVLDTAGVYSLSVKGENNAGNAAITAGATVYYDSAATPKINIDSTNGVRFGYAMAAVASGATSTINVKVGY